MLLAALRNEESVKLPLVGLLAEVISETLKRLNLFD